MRPYYLKLSVRALIFLGLFVLLSSMGLCREQTASEPPMVQDAILPTGQRIHPAGETVAFSERPLDIILSDDRKLVFVKGTHHLLVLDASNLEEVERLKYPDGESGSMHGIASKGGLVYITGSQKTLLQASRNAQGKWNWGKQIALSSSNSNPCGLALSARTNAAYVCLSMRNSLALVDLAKGVLTKEIPTGVCPMAVTLDKNEHFAYVSNFGGRLTHSGDHVENSAGTPVLVDERSISTSGTLSRIDLSSAKNDGELAVGLHPADLRMSNDGKCLYVANANSDSVSVVNTSSFTVSQTIPIRFNLKLPFGSVPNAICLSQNGQLLFTANGGINALAILQLASKTNHENAVKGFIPAGWFPGAICCDEQYIYVANTKGESSRFNTPDAKKFNSKTNRGSVSKVRIPSNDELPSFSKQVENDIGVQDILSSSQEKPRGDRKPIPIPERLGEPSSIEYVVYVIKENRTYDQVFGDMARGNNDSSLCTYGREVTPNHHALADEFILLDNYYCNGVVSADGHQWATQGVITDYQEKMFGGHPRGYDFGTDPLANAGCNFLWDSALQHGLSFRNYGEFDFPELVSKTDNWFDVYAEFKKSQQVKFQQSILMDTLRKYSCPDYPGWNLAIPDVMRVQCFLKELKQYEKTGDLPRLLIVYLPQDHTAGVSKDHPSPRALIADNDLALGQLVDGISHSRFWPKTVIFVNEDDPQDGWDHVDGHRSLCLVVSPYAKRNAVISKFYNQDSVLRTMERILGLPSSNQLTAVAPLMDDCFTAKPDLTPYTAKANQIALDERSVKVDSGMSKDERKLIAATERLDLSRPDRINDDTFNRILWHASKGNAQYPSRVAGAHGKGLKNLHLKLVPAKNDD